MKQEKILERLKQISIIPKHGTEDYKSWLEQKDFLQLLSDTCKDEIPLYVSYKGTYIYSVLLPQNCLRGNYIEDLMHWDCRPDSSWAYGYSYSKKGKSKNISISHPFERPGSKLLKKASPLTFLRSFEGRIGQKGYIEISQLLIHLHGLHLLEERKAYCRLNDDGDIDEVIKIHYPQSGEIAVTIKQDVLDFHLFLTKSVLLRFFDRPLCYDWMKFRGGSRRQESIYHDKRNEISARQGITFDRNGLPEAGWLRGLQIIRNRQPRNRMVKILSGECLEAKKYETFIAYDWKHKKIAKCSCDPKELSNYFTESDKPFVTSPAFFKPEVLSKYKQNPEKYTLEQRSIRCRGSWSLKTYDINEAGQVHTYLIYLGYLPHSEQLYWKAHNEKPKGTISKRAFTTDFIGTWDLSYEPLSSLKNALGKLEEEKSGLWTCSDKNVYQRLNYPVTDSLKEWADEIHTLDKLVIEGFKKQYLKELATSLHCYDQRSEEDQKLNSLSLLKKILEAKEINTQEVDGIISPLKEVHSLRTKLAGHSTGDEAVKIRKQLISQHRSLKEHFRVLVGRTDKSIKALLEIKL